MGKQLLPQTNLLLSSKIQAPPLRSDLVARPLHLQKLEKILDPQVKVALILAPAGSGKTTLVSDWASAHPNEIMWFSVDETEDPPHLFWQYLIAAIQVIIPRFKNPLEFTNSGLSEIDVHNGLVNLINTIAGYKKNFVVVLEDLHNISDYATLSELLFLIENLPKNLSMIITSRQEPTWHLLKLRAKNSLIEIQAQELAFSNSEASELLWKMNVHDFDESDLASIVQKTEGWVFALKRSAIKISEFNSSQDSNTKFNFVNEYLESEVFNIFPADTQEFMVDISILDCFCSPLCATVTGLTDAKRHLDNLKQKNLFLLPVDGQYEWYRFHRLFLDLLRTKQCQRSAEQLTLLHSRASEWYERNDSITAAVDHALRSEDYERTVGLIENNLFRIMDHSELLRQSELISTLPAEILHSRLELAIANAWLLAYAGNSKDAEHCLSDAEISLKKGVRDLDRRNLEGKILAVQAYIHWLRGENDQTIRSASQALIYLSPGDVLNRSITLISFGGALEDGGQLMDALEVYNEAIETCQIKDCAHIHILACAAKVRLLLNLGQLQKADSFAELTIQHMTEVNPDKSEGCAAMGIIYAHRAHIHRTWNDLKPALEMADEGVRLGKRWGQADTLITTLSNKAAVLWSMDKKKDAQHLIDEAKQITTSVSPWYQNYLKAYLILWGIEPKLWNHESKWLDQNGTISETDFNHHEVLLCRARVRLLYSNHRYIEALNWLDMIKEDAKKNGTQVVLADAHVMEAMCLFEIGELEKSMEVLSKALDQIAIEKAYSLILDKDENIVKLLEEMIKNGQQTEFVNLLLVMINTSGRFNQPQSGKSRLIGKQLLTRLSTREREILGYLATHKTSTEIAEALTVSANTVRFHIKSIYNKLDVHSRDEAVVIAQKLKLL